MMVLGFIFCWGVSGLRVFYFSMAEADVQM